jgi:methyltransferase (TIGR00027 family)
MQRAAHQLLESTPVLDDPVAVRILGTEREKMLRDSLSREQAPGLQQVRAFLVARSRLAEDMLAACWKRGVRQYVVLGAGLDTFAYRNPLEGLTVYEVDSPATQRWKKRLLKGAGIAAAGTVFVPADLERDDLDLCLREAGLQAGQGAFFSLLGLTAYIDAAATMALLRWISRFPGPGGVFFDYHLTPEILGTGERRTLASLAARAARAGEPFKAFFDPRELVRTVETLGFTRVRDWGAEEINGHYFPERQMFRITGEVAHLLFAGRD